MFDSTKHVLENPNMTLTKIFKKVNNHVIKLAGTNYLTNILSNKTRKDDIKISHHQEDNKINRVEHNTKVVKESIRIFQLHMDRSNYNNAVNVNRIQTSKPRIRQINIQEFNKLDDSNKRFIFNSISIN